MNQFFTPFTWLSCIIDSHALVRFLEEDKTAVIPVQRIQQKDTLEYGGSSHILWSNKKRYHAFFICSGMLK